MKKINPILRTDSYKASHFLQYPLGTDGYFGYIEARRSLKAIEPIPETVFFGLQIFLKEYLSQPITREDIDEAKEFFEKHGEPYNLDDWEYILYTYDGYMPVTIKAVPEGMVIPEGNVLVTIECADTRVPWIGSYLETSLLRAVWYGSTVATNSRECKKVLWKYLQLTSDNPEETIKFKLHDFGARGVSSSESAGIGGAAHLVNFMGSDTIEGTVYANKYYNCDMASFSIPAAEHSTITSWGRENEVEAYRNMLNKFAKPGAILACVSDSYDIRNACEKLWGESLKQQIINSGATIVVRPDSGIPSLTVLMCLNILADKFGYTINKKGYKVLNYVRVIQGDGINLESIKEICKLVVQHGYSLDNVNFGMGGALLQHLNRDTLRFAMKCSSIRINGKWNDVYKDPVGDPTKKSKAGKISLYRTRYGHATAGKYITMRLDESDIIGEIDEVLRPVYINGKLLNETTFNEVRKRASL